MMFDLIAFDADDTLWHNETHYSLTQEKFSKLLEPYHDREWIESRLFATEMRNLRLFGYGTKGFALSMIETAIELTEGQISGKEIQTIIDYVKAMLQAPIQLLPGVRTVLSDLSTTSRVMVITKGDLFDQESKFARSELDTMISDMEILSEKDEASYRSLLEKRDINPSRFLMVGNSMRSDILPVLHLGGYAVHIPYQITWQHETADASQTQCERCFTLETIGQLPALLQQLKDSSVP